MRNFLSLIFAFFFLANSFGQTLEEKRPKLVVGIVVDQMRYDYLTRFYNKYGDDGFKHIIRNGFSAENAHFNYLPTYTAPGHASIYTGTTPSNHGIIGNNWYDKFAKKSIYCVDDNSYKSIGSDEGGEKSPKRMLTTTIGDELKMAQNQRGKVIALSIKDRAAVLPGGHTADAAYWFQGKKEGKFITSSYYMKNLPKWVVDFNASGKAKNYLNSTWSTMYDINTYTESMNDNNIYEGVFHGIKSPTFPYNLSKLKKKNGQYDLLKTTPFGNSIVKDFAKAAILGENLGKGEATDFLAISFSSTDYIGHKFGPDSKEIEDTYIRLDKDIASLLTFLDKQIGKANYTLFLTADHAAVQVPAYLESLKVPAGYFDKEDFEAFTEMVVQEEFKLRADDLIENISNYQLFLNKETLKKNKLNLRDVSDVLVNRLVEYKSISKTVSAYTLQNTDFDRNILNRLQNGYHQKFSGDVLLIPNPATISRARKGTTHGSGYNYDSHVPILMYGKGIKKGVLKRSIAITDIAPTIANLLNITPPNSATGTVITEALKE